MRHRLPLVIWLLLVWLALWEDISPANLLIGAGLALVLLLAAPAIGPTRSPVLRPLATLRFLLVFAWKIVEANAIVAWEVVTPRSRINEGIVAVPLRQSTSLLTTLVANAVTLTPGTLTLEVERDGRGVTLFVHVLQLRSPDDVRRDVLRFEELIVRAFGDAETVAAVISGAGPPAPTPSVNPRGDP
jgi:multicomponent Na+:H+ antiporter subunit E